MIITIIILTILLLLAGFAIRNLTRKTEILEDFIAAQSEAIDTCNNRLNQIDDKGLFISTVGKKKPSLETTSHY